MLHGKVVILLLYAASSLCILNDLCQWIYTTNRSYRRRHLMNTILGLVHVYFRKKSITGHDLIYR